MSTRIIPNDYHSTPAELREIAAIQRLPIYTGRATRTPIGHDSPFATAPQVITGVCDQGHQALTRPDHKGRRYCFVCRRWQGKEAT